MTDSSIQLNAHSSVGRKLATDVDDNSKDHQYVKIEFGASGTQTPVSLSDPLPVSNISGYVVDSAGVKRTVQRSFLTLPNLDAGDHTVIPAQGPGVKIRALLIQYASAAVLQRTLFWKSGATRISADFHLPGGVTQLFIASYNPHGWYETGENEALILSVGTAPEGTSVEVVWIPV